MSCHNIGRAMNSVVDAIISLYDNNEIDLEAARKIIAAARKGVHRCDGNEYEAIESIRECRCGRCLRNLDANEPIYSVWAVSDAVHNKYNILDKDPDILASDGLCLSCFDLVINRYTNDNQAGKRERKYIDENR